MRRGGGWGIEGKEERDGWGGGMGEKGMGGKMGEGGKRVASAAAAAAAAAASGEAVREMAPTARERAAQVQYVNWISGMNSLY